MPGAMRADQLLVDRGLAATRSQAQRLIAAGVRWFDGRSWKPVAKNGDDLPATAQIELLDAAESRYVSRGGLKLEGALRSAGLDVAGWRCLDVGQSTGGFTDCLLTEGATRVYAVDVGHGLLHQRLRDDPRVVVRERENARTLTAASFPDRIDLAVVDASFIGIGALIDGIAAFLPDGAELCALVKPQFEAGREEARRARGVIRDEAVRKGAIDAATSAIASAGFAILGAADCVLPGPKGNVEHFVYARRLVTPPA